MNNIFTEQHRDYINKQITKALKNIDYDKIVRDYIEREFDNLYETCDIGGNIGDMVTQVIYEHLVKAGLLEDKERED